MEMKGRGLYLSRDYLRGCERGGRSKERSLRRVMEVSIRS